MGEQRATCISRPVRPLVSIHEKMPLWRRSDRHPTEPSHPNWGLNLHYHSHMHMMRVWVCCSLLLCLALAQTSQTCQFQQLTEFSQKTVSAGPLGSDTTGDGSPGNPFLTIARVSQSRDLENIHLNRQSMKLPTTVPPTLLWKYWIAIPVSKITLHSLLHWQQ